MEKAVILRSLVFIYTTVICIAGVEVDSSGISGQNLFNENAVSEKFAESEKDFSINVIKREDVSYMINRKESGHSTWNSETLNEGSCSSGFMVSPNSIQWKLAGNTCGFVLFKAQGCRGPAAFDTEGYNIFSDGSMKVPEFESVYFACH